MKKLIFTPPFIAPPYILTGMWLVAVGCGPTDGEVRTSLSAAWAHQNAGQAAGVALSDRPGQEEDDADFDPPSAGGWAGQYLPVCEQARVMRGELPPAASLSGPRAVSLRPSMGVAKHQGGRHTCAAFAAVALLEALTGEHFSEQCISYLSGQRDVGYVYTMMQEVLRGGLMIEAASCPYDPLDRHNVPRAYLAARRPRAVPGRLHARAFPSARGQDPVTFIRQQLAAGAPVALSLYLLGAFWGDAAEVMSSVTLADNWAPEPQGPHLYLPAHSVVAVGYDDVCGTVTLKNSWGPAWKDRGYAQVSYDVLRRLHSNHSRHNPMVALLPL